MGVEAQESVDLQTLTFDQLAEAVRLAAKAVQERPGSDEGVTLEYFAASNRLGISIASICCRKFDGRYFIFLDPSLGRVVAETFATAEEAKSTLVNEIFIPNGYRLME